MVAGTLASLPDNPYLPEKIIQHQQVGFGEKNHCGPFHHQFENDVKHKSKKQLVTLTTILCIVENGVIYSIYMTYLVGIAVDASSKWFFVITRRLRGNAPPLKLPHGPLRKFLHVQERAGCVCKKYYVPNTAFCIWEANVPISSTPTIYNYSCNDLPIWIYIITDRIIILM